MTPPDDPLDGAWTACERHAPPPKPKGRRKRQFICWFHKVDWPDEGLCKVPGPHRKEEIVDPPPRGYVLGCPDCIRASMLAYGRKVAVECLDIIDSYASVYDRPEVVKEIRRRFGLDE